MKKIVVLSVLCLFLVAVTGCSHPHGAPPGQVKKHTGYNPASGKVDVKKVPPGQSKKKHYKK